MVKHFFSLTLTRIFFVSNILSQFFFFLRFSLLTRIIIYTYFVKIYNGKNMESFACFKLLTLWCTMKWRIFLIKNFQIYIYYKLIAMKHWCISFRLTTYLIKLLTRLIMLMVWYNLFMRRYTHSDIQILARDFRAVWEVLHKRFSFIFEIVINITNTICKWIIIRRIIYLTYVL